tara:strand:+ start:149 stop:319 length:171 start_codon:yes stop_codon:yes gene_type:complete
MIETATILCLAVFAVAVDCLLYHAAIRKYPRVQSRSPLLRGMPGSGFYFYFCGGLS